MKCDELKPLVFSLNDLAYIDESAVKKNFENPHDHAVYKATEVDAAIAELKSEIKRKEGVGQRWFERCMEARGENVKLKRALWMARAEIARTSAWVFWNRKDDYNYNKWKKVERKCRAKAKEYL